MDRQEGAGDNWIDRWDSSWSLALRSTERKQRAAADSGTAGINSSLPGLLAETLYSVSIWYVLSKICWE